MEATKLLPAVLAHLPAVLGAADVHRVIRGYDGRHYPTTLGPSGREYVWLEGEPGPYVDGLAVDAGCRRLGRAIVHGDPAEDPAAEREVVTR